MKMFCISDNIDTTVGLGLAGINSVILHEKHEIINKIEEIIKDNTIGILIFTVKISNIIKKEIDDIKQTRKTPLIIIIPDRHINS